MFVVGVGSSLSLAHEHASLLYVPETNAVLYKG